MLIAISPPDSFEELGGEKRGHVGRAAVPRDGRLPHREAAQAALPPPSGSELAPSLPTFRLLPRRAPRGTVRLDGFAAEPRLRLPPIPRDTERCPVASHELAREARESERPSRARVRKTKQDWRCRTVSEAPGAVTAC